MIHLHDKLAVTGLLIPKKSAGRIDRGRRQALRLESLKERFCVMSHRPFFDKPVKHGP
jgi:hypothetical protein